MSTESITAFEWSVKLSDVRFFVGVASQLIPREDNIYKYDSNALFYYADNGSSSIKAGQETIHSNLCEYKTGDIVHFRFQPQKKKLVIDAVKNVQFI